MGKWSKIGEINVMEKLSNGEREEKLSRSKLSNKNIFNSLNLVIELFIN